MSSNISDFFTKCNMKRYCEVKIGEGETEMVLPFCFDVSKIIMTTDNTEDFLLDYRDDLKIKKIKKNLASFLDDVALEMFTFEQDDTELLLELAKNNIEFVKVDFDIMLKTKYDLYRFLNLLGYSEYDFVHIGDVVTQNRGNLVTKFINTISDSLLIKNSGTIATR